MPNGQHKVGCPNYEQCPQSKNGGDRLKTCWLSLNNSYRETYFCPMASTKLAAPTTNSAPNPRMVEVEMHSTQNIKMDALECEQKCITVCFLGGGGRLLGDSKLPMKTDEVQNMPY